MSNLKEWIVTVKDRNDLDEIYTELESIGRGKYNFIPDRPLTCTDRRPQSRNTHYMLTEEEVIELKKDPRIESIIWRDPNLKPVSVWTEDGPYSKTLQYKFDETNARRSWGLWRVAVENGYAPDFLYPYDVPGSTPPDKYQDITFSYEGDGVDIIICDVDNLDEFHTEFQGRYQNENWFRFAAGLGYTVPAGAVYNRQNITDTHGTCVGSIAAGRFQGLARKARIYSIAVGDPPFTANRIEDLRIFEFIKAFHLEKKANGSNRPTIVNCSWEYSPRNTVQYYNASNIDSVIWRGKTLTPLGDSLYDGFTDGVNNYKHWQIGLTFKDRENARAVGNNFVSNPLAADINDCISEGIIIVSAAGNNYESMAKVGSPDWDNKFIFKQSVDGFIEHYYMRPANGPRDPACILVGALSRRTTENKSFVNYNDSENWGETLPTYNLTQGEVIAPYSNRGSGIDVFAPTDWRAATYSTVEDGVQRHYYSGFNGTSAAAPCVTGVLACVAEFYVNATGTAPNQTNARNYIQNKSSINKISDSTWTNLSNGPYTEWGLNGAPNRLIFYNDDLDGHVPNTTSGQFNFTASGLSVTEGQSITFTVSDPALNNTPTTFYWRVVNIDTSNADFNSTSGNFTTTGGTGSFSVTATSDLINELQDEEFRVEIRARNSLTAPVVATSSRILIREIANTIVYSITPSSLSVAEGNSITVNVSSSSPTTQTLYWHIKHTTTSGADFQESSGSFVVGLGSGSFTITTRDDNSIEGNQTFTVIITEVDNAYSVPLATSNTITITESNKPTYTITPAAQSINEYGGNTPTGIPQAQLVINVTTTNVANGTSLYWFINNGTTTDSDFIFTSGSFTINNNAGTFSIGIASDFITESTSGETFTVSLKSVNDKKSTSLKTSQQLKIFDPTIPTYRVQPTSGGGGVVEGETKEFTVSTINVANGTVLYWFIDPDNPILANAGNNKANAADFSPSSGSVTINNNRATFQVTVVDDAIAELTEVYAISLRSTNNISGTILASFGVSTISQSSTPTYSVSISKEENNEGTSFTVTLDTVNHPQIIPIKWAWSGSAGLADFSSPASLSGQGNINPTTKKLILTFTTIADSLTEGSENIRVRFWIGDDDSQQSLIAQSQFIYIKDTSTTPVVVKTFSLSSEKTSYNEGETINWVITTTNVPNGTGINWRLQGPGSADSNITGDKTGNAIIQNNSASIQTFIVEDLTTEGPETITLQIKTPTNNDPYNVNRTVTIADTSIDPSYTLTASRSIINEGDTVEFTINTVNVTFPTTVYYENVGQSSDDDFLKLPKGSLTLASSPATFDVTVLEDKLTETKPENIKINLRTNSEYGKIVATSTVNIRDTSKSPSDVPEIVLPRPPVITPEVINTTVNITSIITLTNVVNVPTWKNPRNLGIIEVGEISEIKLESNTRQNFPLTYTLLSGSLPIGLTLNKDGSINGIVKDVFTSTTSTSYSFTVGVKKLGNSFISTSSFNLVVNKTTTTTFTSVYAEPLLSESSRRSYFNLVEDKNIFQKQNLYRPLDPNFGVQRKLQLVIHHGIEQLNVQNFINTISQNFYQRRYLLNTIKVGNAENIKGEPIYEVIYLDIIDQNSKEDGTSLSKSIFIQGAQYFPSSLINIRSRLEDTGKFTDSKNPRFMKTPQPNSTKELGYVPAVPICYALPGKSKLILNKLERLKINWNLYDFTIDRIFIKDLTTGNILNFRLPKNPRIT